MGLYSYHIMEIWVTSTNLKTPFPKGKCVSYFFWSAPTDDNENIHLSATGWKGIQY